MTSKDASSSKEALQGTSDFDSPVGARSNVCKAKETVQSILLSGQSPAGPLGRRTVEAIVNSASQIEIESSARERSWANGILEKGGMTQQLRSRLAELATAEEADKQHSLALISSGNGGLSNGASRARSGALHASQLEIADDEAQPSPPLQWKFELETANGGSSWCMHIACTHTDRNFAVQLADASIELQAQKMNGLLRHTPAQKLLVLPSNGALTLLAGRQHEGLTKARVSVNASQNGASEVRSLPATSKLQPSAGSQVSRSQALPADTAQVGISQALAALPTFQAQLSEAALDSAGPELEQLERQTKQAAPSKQEQGLTGGWSSHAL